MSLKKITAAGLLAFSLSTAAIGSSVMAPKAFAETNVSTIDANHAGGFNLHITKYLGAPTGGANDGTKLPNAPALPLLQGVVFDIYTVQGVDLTTNAGWTAATALQGHAITADEISAGKIIVDGVTYNLVKSPTTYRTNAQGQVDYTASAPQLVLVNENLAASGATVTNVTDGSAVKVNTITPSKPFFATLPMTNPAGDTWNYDVYAYPKNSSDTATKSVVDKGTVTLEDSTNVNKDQTNAVHIAEFTVSGTITPNLTGETMGVYKLSDELDARLKFVKTVSVSAGGTSLVAGQDFTETVVGQKVTIAMTAQGLTKVAAAKSSDPAAKVSWVFDASLLTEGDGTIENTAYVIPNKSWVEQNPDKPGVPTDQTVEKYGDLKLLKQDGKDHSALNDAVFSLYRSYGKVEDKQSVCDAATADAANLVMKGITTSNGGIAIVKGLQASSWYDNAPAPADANIIYCLVETKAPEGYNLQAKSIPFTISEAKPVDINVPAETTLPVTELTVFNERRNLDNGLPLTGGSGAAAMSIGGLVLIGTSVALVVAKRRRDEELEA